MFLRHGRCVQVRGERARSFAALAFVIGVCPFLGCGRDPLLSDLIDQDTTTLAETVSTEADEPWIDGQSPALAGADGSVQAFSIGAGRGFCCNPLTIEFSVQSFRVDEHGQAEFAWDFGDMRRGAGSVVQHTYSFSGEYEITLEGRFSDGTTLVVTESYIVDLTRLVRVDHEASSSDSEDSMTVIVVADAGQDQVVAAGNMVTLDAAGSQVWPAQPMIYLWTQIGG
ncbi:MAG: PKD domain-containing protein, partial [Planctomycetes bacterium]|nr:PKD domain-containing protein [Planctomycetota bacterium]